MVKIQTIEGDDFLSNCYIAIQDDKALIIDPSYGVKTIKHYLKDLKVVGVLLTHGHYDHFIGLEEVVKTYNVSVYCHKEAYKKLKDPNLSCGLLFGYNYIYPIDSNINFVKDGEVLNIDSFTVKVIYTIGHTNCSVSYIIDNNMFTGDSLFKEGIGRYDLPTASFNDTKNTLNIFKHLKHDYNVYPGHGEESTIFYEQKHNYYLK